MHSSKTPTNWIKLLGFTQRHTQEGLHLLRRSAFTLTLASLSFFPCRGDLRFTCSSEPTITRVLVIPVTVQEPFREVFFCHTLYIEQHSRSTTLPGYSSFSHSPTHTYAFTSVKPLHVWIWALTIIINIYGYYDSLTLKFRLLTVKSIYKNIIDVWICLIWFPKSIKGVFLYDIFLLLYLFIIILYSYLTEVPKCVISLS